MGKVGSSQFKVYTKEWRIRTIAQDWGAAPGVSMAERICCTSVYFRLGRNPLPTSRLSQCDAYVGAEGPGLWGGPLTVLDHAHGQHPPSPSVMSWVLRAQAPEAWPLTCSDHAHGQQPPRPVWCHVSAEGLGPRRRGAHLFWTMLMATSPQGTRVLPNEVLEHDECLHWVLQQQSKTHLSSCFIDIMTEGPRSSELFTLFFFFLVQKWKGHSLSLCKPNETNRGGFSNEILQLITRRLSHRYKWNMNMECENPLKM